MYEIELKAWLTKETEQHAETVLNKIGVYDGITDKRDTYWHKNASACAQIEEYTDGTRHEHTTKQTSPVQNNARFEPTPTQSFTTQTNTTQKVRIRSQTCLDKDGKVTQTQTLVTLKNKENPGKVEVNEEIEFCVATDFTQADTCKNAHGSESAEIAFAIFLRVLGFVPKETKHKTTKNWRIKDYHVEIAQIENLGTFLEIETLAPTNDEKTVNKCKAGLYNLLKDCGVSQDAIEPRYYTTLLKERAPKNE